MELILISMHLYKILGQSGGAYIIYVYLYTLNSDITHAAHAGNVYCIYTSAITTFAQSNVADW